MTIQDLIGLIGMENIKVQFLGQSMSGIRTCKDKSGRFTEISFVTKEMTPNDVMQGKSKVGIVLWVEPALYEQAVKKFQEKQDQV